MSKKKIAPVSQSELALRKYCIEVAMRWPTITHRIGNWGGGTYGAGGGGETISDADIIGRAEKIRQYLRGANA